MIEMTFRLGCETGLGSLVAQAVWQAVQPDFAAVLPEKHTFLPGSQWITKSVTGLESEG